MMLHIITRAECMDGERLCVDDVQQFVSCAALPVEARCVQLLLSVESCCFGSNTIQHKEQT
jgi:hypothetical protein